MKKVLIGLFFLIQNMGFSQSPSFEIPKEATVGTLFNIINQKYEFDAVTIERNQSYGWNKYANKINADSFFIATKKYCIERVGEAYFYENFRYYIHTFNDDVYSNTYTIRYRFYPPGFKAKDYLDIVFKSLDFLNIHASSFPENLPDCRKDSTKCYFPITREKVNEIIQTNLMIEKNMEISIWELDNYYQWQGSFIKNGRSIGRFFIDARTGEISSKEKRYK